MAHDAVSPDVVIGNVSDAHDVERGQPVIDDLRAVVVAGDRDLVDGRMAREIDREGRLEDAVEPQVRLGVDLRYRPLEREVALQRDAVDGIAGTDGCALRVSDPEPEPRGSTGSTASVPGPGMSVARDYTGASMGNRRAETAGRWAM